MPAASLPNTPVHTAPLQEAQRGAWSDGPDLITALREFGPDAKELEYLLPSDVRLLTIGASRKCDLTLHGRGLSAKHGQLERVPDGMRLVDLGSTNGTYFRDCRVSDAKISPGDTFTLAPVTFLALNDEMRVHRPTFVDVLGTGLQPSPDRLLIEAARGSSHLILTGEPNCDQDRLAQAIHAVSLRRRRPHVELRDVPESRQQERAVLDSAARSTLLLMIEPERRPLDPSFVSMIYSPSYHVRVIVLAATVDIARAALGQSHVDQMQHVWVRPLSQRSEDIERLLDRLLAERQAPIRTANFSADNRAGLRGPHDWSKNLEDLRQIADAIVAYEIHKGQRGAANELGMSRTAFQRLFESVGMSTPLRPRADRY